MILFEPVLGSSLFSEKKKKKAGVLGSGIRGFFYSIFWFWKLCSFFPKF